MGGDVSKRRTAVITVTDSSLIGFYDHCAGEIEMKLANTQVSIDTQVYDFLSFAPVRSRWAQRVGMDAGRQRDLVLSLAITGSVEKSAVMVGCTYHDVLRLRCGTGSTEFSDACDDAVSYYARSRYRLSRRKRQVRINQKTP